VVDAEVTMTVYQAVLRLQAFRDSAGRFPEAVDEAFEGPEDTEGFAYQRLAEDRFRLSVVRGDQVVVYETGDSLASLAARAVQTLQQVRR